MLLTPYQLYNKMLKNMGPTNWWPADSKIEIICGAILIQNTAAPNAEQAVENLRKATNFNPDRILRLGNNDLQELIRVAGFYKNKSRAIQEILKWYKKFEYQYATVVNHFGTNLRKELLSQRGIGDETADVLLTYVFEIPTFISDKYARTLFTHLGVKGLTNYKSLATLYRHGPNFSVSDAKEFHGLIDEFGKKYFRRQDTFTESFLANDSIKLVN